MITKRHFTVTLGVLKIKYLKIKYTEYLEVSLPTFATRTLRTIARHAKLHPGVTIIIINWNSAGLLRTTLTAIRRFTRQDVSILIVDNSSKDDSRPFLRTLQDCRVMRLPYNVGHGYALDLGFLMARTEIVVALDVDAFPISHEWLKTLTAPLVRGYHIVGAHIHRNFAHPCCLAMPLRWFIERNHTFQPNWGLGTSLGITEWDVGELISIREKGHVLLIEPSEIRGPGHVGTIFGGVVYHNFYGTRHYGLAPGALLDGISRDDATRAWAEAKERFLGAETK